MGIRSGFLYALVVVVFLALGLSMVDSLMRIREAEAILATSLSTVPVTTTHGTWQASQFLDETSKAAQIHTVKREVLQQDAAQNDWQLVLDGSEKDLVAYYAWFEKEAGVSHITGMELKPHEQEKRMVIGFVW